MPELQGLTAPEESSLQRPAKNNQLTTLVILIMILLGLLLFYWFLNKPPEAVTQREAPGITHVFSIYGVSRKDLLSYPNAVHVTDNGDIYVADTGNDRVVIFNRRGRFKSEIKTRGKKLKAGDLITPLGVTVDSKGRIYTASFDSGLMVFNSKGKTLEQLPIQGTQVYTAGELVYLAAPGSIYAFDGKMEIARHIGSQGRKLGQFETPQDLLVTEEGNLVVSDSQNMRLQVFNKKGEVIAYQGEPPQDLDDSERFFGLGTGMTQDDLGRIYVADAFHHAIRVFDEDGDDLGEVGTQGDTDGLFNYPSDITYMGGNTFAVADKWNDRVQILRINVEEARAPGEEASEKAREIPLWAYGIGLLVLLVLIALVLRRLLLRRAKSGFEPPSMPL